MLKDINFGEPDGQGSKWWTREVWNLDQLLRYDLEAVNEIRADAGLPPVFELKPLAISRPGFNVNNLGAYRRRTRRKRP